MSTFFRKAQVDEEDARNSGLLNKIKSTAKQWVYFLSAQSRETLRSRFIVGTSETLAPAGVVYNLPLMLIEIQ